MNRNQKTLLAVVAIVTLAIAFYGAVGYVVLHFIAKYW